MEMREAEVIDIEGFTYEVRPLPTTQGLRLMHTLAQVMGAGVSVVMEGPQGIAKMVPEMVERITPEKLTEVCAMLGARTSVRVGDKKPSLTGEFFEAHFAARYHVLVQWLRFSLEVNFGPLGAWLRTVTPSAVAPTTKPSA